MKNTYTMQDFLAGKVAVVPGTSANAEKFLRELDGLGVRWGSGDGPTSAWSMEFTTTHPTYPYAFTAGALGYASAGAAWYTEKGIPAIPYTDLITDPREELHITTEGRQTHAVYKRGGKMISKATVSRHVNDEHDFSVGAGSALMKVFEMDEDMALTKLFGRKGPKVREVARRAEVGEWIKIKDDAFTISGKYEAGSIGEVVDVATPATTSCIVRFGTRYIFVFPEAYVVLEGYQPKEARP